MWRLRISVKCIVRRARFRAGIALYFVVNCMVWVRAKVWGWGLLVVSEVHVGYGFNVGL